MGNLGVKQKIYNYLKGLSGETIAMIIISVIAVILFFIIFSWQVTLIATALYFVLTPILGERTDGE